MNRALKRLVKEKIEEPISDVQIEQAVPGIKIQDHQDLTGHESLDSFFGPKGITALLYNTTPEVGHWVLLTRLAPDTVEFFDPYSLRLDNPEYTMDNRIRDIIWGGGVRNVVFNDTPLQEHSAGVNTCGRHTIVRALFRKLPLIDYIHLLKHNDLTDDPDEYVTLLTLDV